MIGLHEVIKQMNAVDESGKPLEFSIRFVSCNKQKKVAGRLIEVRSAIVSKRHSQYDAASFVSKGKKKEPEKQLKAPNHNENGTVNIIAMPSGRMIKIRLMLITRFNGERVL